ncbi:hypothetical protein [Pararobbsia silviterrae]|uniref:BON domain-containing protein n=1 Tax=Pararobbsia silviterrae TaxID=1792498 RepID=A0A494XZW7_9BURK|nr:hypothetical protein [Pararobbsia silviterrae]RKP56057.1 hypothetical protein D7S86_12215 [Pararobbsia silviterrae]
MNRSIRADARVFARFACVLGLSMSMACQADAPRRNHGDDPFFSISNGIARCPVPLGPLQTDEEWLANAHNRIEHGNNCWSEGRCRLANAYAYDKEIAETVGRRLRHVDTLGLNWRQRTTLWLVIQSRVIFVQGCVAPDFDIHRFVFVLGQTADVDRVIDDTMTDPASADVPYRTQADPDRMPADKAP